MIIPFTNNVLFFFVEYNYNKIHAVMEVMYFYSWGQKFFMIPFLLLGALPHGVSINRPGHCSSKLFLWNTILLKFGFSWSTLKWMFWSPRENCTDTMTDLGITYFYHLASFSSDLLSHTQTWASSDMMIKNNLSMVYML